MKHSFTSLLIVLLSAATFTTKANTYNVCTQSELSAAMDDAKITPATNANPHVINIRSGGSYNLSELSEPTIINGPLDLSARVAGYYFNFGTSLSGKHFTFNNLLFFYNFNTAFGSSFMSSNGGGTSIINNCRFTDNWALYQAGGIFNNGDTILINGCSFDKNSVLDVGGQGGGAVFNNGGYVKITNCTFSNNETKATVNTGGGGAVKNHAGGNMEIVGCTFYNNRSFTTGGALSNLGGGTCDISNSIFVGNSAANGGNNLFGTFTSTYGHNIFSDILGATIGGVTTGNVNGAVTTSVIDTFLLDNGHYMWTHALVSGSPAIDAANAAITTTKDVREYARSGAPDIGPIEFSGTNPCVGFSTSINNITPSSCFPQNNSWSSVTTTIGNALTGSYWNIINDYEYRCGDTLQWVGNGTFAFTVFDANNCIAKDTASLDITAPQDIYNEVTICDGSSITIGNNTYTSAGQYIDTFACDSVVYTDLIVKPLLVPSIAIQPATVLDLTQPEVVPATSNRIYNEKNLPEYAFDGDTTNYGWGAKNSNGDVAFLAYDYGAGNEVALTSYGIYLSCNQIGGWCSSSYSPDDWTFEGSNGSTWTVLHTVTNAGLVVGALSTFNFTNTTPYRKYRINISGTQSGNYPRITELYLAGASYRSIVTASDVYDIDNIARNAFDNDTTDYGWANEGNGLPSWLAYNFGTGNSQVVEAYSIYNSCDQEGGWCSDDYSPKSWRFEATNDDVTWTTLDTVADGQIVIGQRKVFNINNNTAYRKYRIFITASDDADYVRITEVELLQYNELCDLKTFTATVQNGGDAPSLQWKVNGSNAGNGGNTQTFNSLNPGDVITCVLTATNQCQSSNTASSNTLAYAANINNTVTATVCKDSVVINGTPVNTSGTYTYTGTTTAGCDSIITYVLTVNNCGTIGLSELAKGLNIQLMPNPASDILMLYCDETIVAIEVYSMVGAQVAYERGDVRKIFVSNLPNGIYSIQLTTQSGVKAVRKFLKQ